MRENHPLPEGASFQEVIRDRLWADVERLTRVAKSHHPSLRIDQENMWFLKPGSRQIDPIYPVFKNSVPSEAKKIEDIRMKELPVPEKIQGTQGYIVGVAYEVTARITPTYVTIGGKARDVKVLVTLRAYKEGAACKFKLLAKLLRTAEAEELANDVEFERNLSAARAAGVLSRALKRPSASAGGPGTGKRGR